MLVFVLSACTDVAVVGDKHHPGRDSGGEDSAGDSADSGGETPSIAGDYSGPVRGLYEWQGNEEVCIGEATLTIAADNTFAGDAACTSNTWGLLDGALSGSGADGVVTGAWTVFFSPDTVDQELVGTVSDGLFEVTTTYENAYGAFSSTISLTRK